MALIQCRECHQNISDSDAVCPYCGTPVAKPKRKRYQVYISPERNKAKVRWILTCAGAGALLHACPGMIITYFLLPKTAYSVAYMFIGFAILLLCVPMLIRSIYALRNLDNYN